MGGSQPFIQCTKEQGCHADGHGNERTYTNMSIVIGWPGSDSPKDVCAHTGGRLVVPQTLLSGMVSDDKDF